MKIIDKLISLYSKLPNTGSLGLKITGLFLLSLFILNGFDSAIVREVFE